MTDLEIMEKAIIDGYYVVGIFPIDAIQDNHNEYLRTRNYHLSVDAFIETFDLQKRKDVLLSPENRDKFVIILKNSCRGQIEIITSEPQCIMKAKRQIEYQKEPIGLSIIVHCAVSGGSSDLSQIIHVDKLINQLNCFSDSHSWGWHFKQTEESRFEASKKLDSINREEAEQEFKRLRDLLNYVAIALKIGIRIERYAVSQIPRIGPYSSYWGPIEFMPSITAEEIKKFEKFLSMPPEIHEIADGLNQTYILTSIGNRLTLLWAITEAVFAGEPQPLLSNDEIKSILKCAQETLKEEQLSELNSVLTDPNRLPSKSRNRRISENIAKELKLNVDDVYEEITRASRARGKYQHEMKFDQELYQAENYLRSILETYLKKRIDCTLDAGLNFNL